MILQNLTVEPLNVLWKERLKNLSGKKIVPNQKEYEDEIRRVYGLPAEESIKRGRKVERILEQIEWPDIKTAIERAEKIAIDNEGRQENITAGNNIYYDNPDTQMHVLLKFLFKKVGVNIETLG